MSTNSNPFRSFGKKSGKKLRRSLGSTLSLAPFTSTPTTISRQGSVTSLRSMSVSPTYDTEDAKNQGEGWKSAFKRKFTNKSSNEQKEDNRSIKSLSLSISPIKRNSMSNMSISLSPAKMLDVHESFLEESETPRGIERRDLVVCWLDHNQFKIIRGKSRNEDIFTKLIERHPTRHLARHILTYLRIGDLSAMQKVTHSWKKFLNSELEASLLYKIKSQENNRRKNSNLNNKGIRTKNPFV